jgi:hypothetical protein
MNYGPRVVTSGCVLALDTADRNSYPESGASWNDLSGVSNVNTDTSLVTYANSSFSCTALNQYIWFGGSVASLKNLTDSGNSHSFELWFSPLGPVPGANDGYLFGRRGFHSGFYQNKSEGTGRRIGPVLIWYSDSSNSSVGNFVMTNLNTWAHLVMVVDQQNNFAYAYYNGVLNGSAVSLTKALRSYGTADYYLFSGSGTDFSGNGKIAVARIYNRALTSAEVLQNFNASRIRFGV